MLLPCHTTLTTLCPPFIRTSASMLTSFVVCTIFMHLAETVVATQQLAECPTAALEVNMTSHFSNSAITSLRFHGCHITAPITLRNLNRVDVMFSNCTFHLGDGALLLRGTLDEASLVLASVVVVRWWLLHVTSTTAVEDTVSSLSSSLVVVDGAADPVVLRKVTINVTQLGWNARSYNTSLQSNTVPAAVQAYVDGASWRQPLIRSSAWSAYIFRAVGVVSITETDFYWNRVTASDLVGSLSLAIASNFINGTLLEGPAAWAAAVQQCGGMPLMRSVHLMAVASTMAMTASRIDVVDCALDFGGGATAGGRTTAGGVPPGGNASVISIEAPANAGGVVDGLSVFIAQSSISLAAMALPPHGHTVLFDLPHLLYFNGTFVHNTLTTLTSTLALVRVVGPLGGTLLGSLIVSKLSLTIDQSNVSSAVLVGPLEGDITSVVGRFSAWLAASNGSDVLATGALLMAHLSRWDGLVVRASSCVFVFAGLPPSTTAFVAQLLNASSSGSMYAGRIVAVPPLLPLDVDESTAATRLSGPTAVAQLLSLYASIVAVGALGIDGIRNVYVSVHNSSVLCTVGCEALNLTAIDLSLVALGRDVGLSPHPSAVLKLSNATVSWMHTVVRTEVDRGHLAISSFAMQQASAASPRYLTVAHRLLRTLDSLTHDNIGAIATLIQLLNVTMSLMVQRAPLQDGPLSRLAVDVGHQLLFPPDGWLGGAHMRGAATHWPAVIDVTAFQAVNLVVRILGSAMDCGWGQDCLRFDTGNINPSRSGSQVQDVVVNITGSTLTCRGWQTRCVVFSTSAPSQSENTRVSVFMRDATLYHYNITPHSGARTLLLSGLASGGPEKQSMVVTLTRVAVHTFLEYVQLNRVANETFRLGVAAAAPGTPIASKYAVAAVCIANLTLKGVEPAYDSSVAVVNCTFRVRMAQGGPRPSIASFLDMGTFFVASHGYDVASPNGSGVALRVIADTRETVGSALLLDGNAFTGAMRLLIDNSSLESNSVALDVTPSNSMRLNAQLVVSGTAVRVECVLLRNGSSTEAVSFLIDEPWRDGDTSRNGTAWWSRCSAMLLMAGEVQSASSVRIEASSMVAASLAIADVADEGRLISLRCDTATMSLSGIVLYGDWLTAQLVVSNSTVVVDGFVALSPAAQGAVVVSSAFGLRSWGHPLPTGVSQLSRSSWNATSTLIQFTLGANASVNSLFGPAVVVYLQEATVTLSALQGNVYPIFPNLFAQRTVNNVSVFDYISWFAPATTLTARSVARLPALRGSSAQQASTLLCDNTAWVADSKHPWTTDLQHPPMVAHAYVVWCAERCVMSATTINMTDATVGAYARLDQATPTADVAWVAVARNRSQMASAWGNTSLPLRLVKSAAQQRSATILHFGPVASTSSSGLAASSGQSNATTVLANVTIELWRAVATSICETQPIFGGTAPMSGSSTAWREDLNGTAMAAHTALADLQCLSTTVTLAAAADATFLNITVGRNATVHAIVRTGGLRGLDAMLLAAAPDSSSTASAQRGTVALDATLLMNASLTNGGPTCTTDANMLWLYAPQAVMRRAALANASRGQWAASQADFVATSLAANIFVAPQFNATASFTLRQALSAVDEQTLSSQRSHTMLVLFDTSRVAAVAATVAEPSSAVNLYVQHASALSPAPWTLLAKGSAITANIKLLPVLRPNAASGLASLEDTACASWLYNMAASNNTAGVDRSAGSLGEPTTANLLMQDAQLRGFNVTWTNAVIQSTVAPLFFSQVVATMAAPLHYTTLTTANLMPPTNATLMTARSYARHARNIIFTGAFKILEWSVLQVQTAGGAAMEAEVSTGIDGKAENIVFEGSGRIENTTRNVWSLGGVVPSLRAIGSMRSVPMSQGALRCAGNNPAPMLSTNIAIRDNVSSSYHTVLIEGMSLYCQGHCANIDIGRRESSAGQAAVWLGTRVAVTGCSFVSTAPAGVYPGPPPSTTTAMTTLIGTAIVAARLEPELDISLASQGCLHASANVLVGSMGALSSLTFVGTSFFSTGFNVRIDSAVWASVTLVVASDTGYVAGSGSSSWSSAPQAAAIGSYASLGYDVPSMVPRIPSRRSCVLDELSTSVDVRPSVGNVLICDGVFSGQSRLEFRAKVSSRGFEAVLDTTGVAAEQILPSATRTTSEERLLGPITGPGSSGALLMVDVVNVHAVRTQWTTASTLLMTTSDVATPVGPLAFSARLRGFQSIPSVVVDVRVGNLWVQRTSVEGFGATVSITVVSTATIQLEATISGTTTTTSGNTTAVAINVAARNTTFACDRASCPFDGLGTDDEVVLASSAQLSAKGFRFATQYRSGLLLSGVSSIAASASLMRETTATNVLLDNAVLSRAILHLSSASTPVHRVSSATATMLATTTALMGRACNMAFVGPSTAADRSSIVLQGFATVATADGSAGNLLATSGTLTGLPSLSIDAELEAMLPGTNLFIGPRVGLSSVRFHFSSASLFSNASNIQCLADAASMTSDTTPNPFGSNVTFAASASSRWSVRRHPLEGGSMPAAACADWTALAAPSNASLLACVYTRNAWNVVFMYASLQGLVTRATSAAPQVASGQLLMYVEDQSNMVVSSNGSGLPSSAAPSYVTVACTSIAYESIASPSWSTSMEMRRAPCAIAPLFSVVLRGGSSLAAYAHANASAVNIALNHRSFDWQPAAMNRSLLFTSSYCNKRVDGPYHLLVDAAERSALIAQGASSTASDSGAVEPTLDASRAVNVFVAWVAQVWGSWNITIALNAATMIAQGTSTAIHILCEQLPLTGEGTNASSLATTPWLPPPSAAAGFLQPQPSGVTVVWVLDDASTATANGTRHARGLELLAMNNSLPERPNETFRLGITAAAPRFPLASLLDVKVSILRASSLTVVVDGSFAADAPLAAAPPVVLPPPLMATYHPSFPRVDFASCHVVYATMVENFDGPQYFSAAVGDQRGKGFQWRSAQQLLLDVDGGSVVTSSTRLVESVQRVSGRDVASKLMVHQSFVTLHRTWYRGRGADVLPWANTSNRSVVAVANVVLRVGQLSRIVLEGTHATRMKNESLPPRIDDNMPPLVCSPPDVATFEDIWETTVRTTATAVAVVDSIDPRLIFPSNNISAASSRTHLFQARNTTLSVSVSDRSTLSMRLTRSVDAGTNSNDDGSVRMLLSPATEVTLLQAPRDVWLTPPSWNGTLGISHLPVQTQLGVAPLLINISTVDANAIATNVSITGSSRMDIALASASSGAVEGDAFVSLWRFHAAVAPWHQLYAHTDALIGWVTGLTNNISTAALPMLPPSCVVPHRAIFVHRHVAVQFSLTVETQSTLSISEAALPQTAPPLSAFSRVTCAVCIVGGRHFIRNASHDVVSRSELVATAKDSNVDPMLGVRPIVGSTSYFMSPAAATLHTGSRWDVAVRDASRVAVAQWTTTVPPRVGATHAPSAAGVLLFLDVPMVPLVVLRVDNASEVQLLRRAPFPNLEQVPPASVLSTQIRSAVVGFTRVPRVDQITVSAERGSVMQTTAGGFVLSLDELDVVTVQANLRFARQARITGPWEGLLNFRRLANGTVLGAAQNMSVTLFQAVASSFVVPCIVLPRAQVVLRNNHWNVTESTVTKSPFVGAPSSMVAFAFHPLSAGVAPLTSLVGCIATMDNVSVVGFATVFQPDTAAMVPLANPRAALTVQVAGGSLQRTSGVGSVVGDWPDAFLGLPQLLAAHMVDWSSVALWNGSPLPLYGYVVATLSLSEEASVSASASASQPTRSIEATQSDSHSTTSSHSLTTSSTEPLSRSASVTATRSAPTATASRTLFLRPCPSVEVMTIPANLLDTDIASGAVDKLLRITLTGIRSAAPSAPTATPDSVPAAVGGGDVNGTGSNQTVNSILRRVERRSMQRLAAEPGDAGSARFTWARDIWDHVSFSKIVQSTRRGETRGFDAVLGHLLVNASTNGGWVAEDDTYQVMILRIPSAPTYELIGSETIQLSFTLNAVAGGCQPWDVARRGGIGNLTSQSVVMTASFTIYPALGNALPAAAAVVAVVGGSIGSALAVFGNAAAFTSVFDMQFLALLGTMQCALPDQIRLAEHIVYVLSPFGGISPQWMALGGCVLAIGLAALHYVAVFLVCFLRRDLPTLLHGKALIRFPGYSLAVASLLLSGIVSGAFHSAEGDDSVGSSPSLGEALVGIAFGIAFMGYLGNVLFRETREMLGFRTYPVQSLTVEYWIEVRPALMSLCMPTGRWMSNIPPYTLDAAYAAVLGPFDGQHRLAAFLTHAHVIVLSVISSYRFSDDLCVAQYALLLAVQTLFTLYYAWARPYRTRVVNVAMVAVHGMMMAVLASNVAYAYEPGPNFSNTQTGLQLGLAVLSVLKLCLLCACLWFDKRVLVQPSPGPPPPPPLPLPPLTIAVPIKDAEDPFDDTPAPTDTKVHSGFSSSDDDERSSEKGNAVSDLVLEPSRVVLNNSTFSSNPSRERTSSVISVSTPTLTESGKPPKPLNTYVRATRKRVDGTSNASFSSASPLPTPVSTPKLTPQIHSGRRASIVEADDDDDDDL